MTEYKKKDFKKADVIMREGDNPDCAYIVKSGSVELFKETSSGEDLILSVLGTGDVFGAMSMVDSTPRSASVRALEDSELIAVDVQTFNEKQEALDVFTRKMVKTLIDRLRAQNQVVANQTDPSDLLKAAKKGQISKRPTEHTNVLIQEDYREKINFGEIKLLLGDVNPQSRQGIKGGLHMQGFREIDDVSNAKDFHNKVSENDYDLIVIDGSIGVADVAAIINKIRHGGMLVNPFTIIFCVIDQPDPKTLELLADAGLDDVLVKPVSIGNIIDRVERRIKKRKAFVVTMDYVGPDRRRIVRPDQEKIPLVDVPNPLTYKALSLMDERSFKEENNRALACIETLKVERYVVQIDWLREKIGNMKLENQDITFFMSKLVEVVDSLTEKLVAKGAESYVPICEQILSRIEDYDTGLAEMTGESWEGFSALTRRLKTELGPQG